MIHVIQIKNLYRGKISLTRYDLTYLPHEHVERSYRVFTSRISRSLCPFCDAGPEKALHLSSIVTTLGSFGSEC